MAVHLYTESWVEPAVASPAAQKQLREAERLLNDLSSLQEQIARHQVGASLPTFVTSRPDLEVVSRHIEPFSRFRHITLAGSSGSIRNTWALYQALFEGNTAKKMHILDSTDPSGLFGRLLAEAGGFSPENTLVIAVSKSGNTERVLQETEALHTRHYPVLIVTSQNDRARLFQFALQRRLPCIAHPDEILGLFTAGQVSSLLPLSILDGGLSTATRIVGGLDSAYEVCAPRIPREQNPAKDLALRLFYAEILDYGDALVPIYGQKLMGVGELIVQLCHESFGMGSCGMSLVSASAPESQYRTNQRFFGRDRKTVGISLQLADFEDDWSLNDRLSAAGFLALEHMSMVEEAQAQNRPWMVVTVDRLVPEDIGKLIGLWQYVAVYSALLRDLNPFDQSAVDEDERCTSDFIARRSERQAPDLGFYRTQSAFHL